jgi:hypothetical protein
VARLRQGEGDLRLPLANDGNDSGNAPMFFQGTMETTLRTAIEISWLPATNTVFSADAGVNRVSNRFFIDGKSAVIPVFRIAANVRFGS